MKLSIGVPAYNQGSYLQETLESILHQDVPFHEIVVSNNHSTDSTAEVIASVQNRHHPGRIRVVVPPQHLTMVANWNFTASQLNGDWFSLLSSDDLALPNFVRSVQAAIALSSNAVLIRGAWRDINNRGESQGDRHLLSVSAVTHPPKTLYEQRFGPKGSFAAFALRRDIWEKAGKFPEEVTLIGDWGMWLLAGALGDVIYTDDVIAAYRAGHQSDTLKARHHIHMREMLVMYQQILPRAARLGGFGEPAWIAEASRKNFRVFIAGTSQEYTLEERSKSIDAFRPWAESTGQLALFKRFERGEILRSPPTLNILKSLIRRARTTLRRPSVET
jgi:glycosyltransferase involved in cell wall biosynthesis